MKAEESIEIEGSFRIAATWCRNRDLLTNVVIMMISERHDHGDSIRGAALKYCDDDRPVLGCSSIGLSECRTNQERGRGGKTGERETTGFNKKATADHKYSNYLL